MNKYFGLHSAMEYYSAIKKKRKNAICSNMEAPRNHHTK